MPVGEINFVHDTSVPEDFIINITISGTDLEEKVHIKSTAVPNNPC
jgi:hypothetical protein